MAQTYTYDPANAYDGALNQMRFELGDTIVDLGNMASALCDEEYQAVLKKYPEWKAARLACLKAITMRLSFEVDTSIDGLSYSLSKRADRWREMYEEAKKETRMAMPIGVPSGKNAEEPPPYFYPDMQRNPRR